MLQQKAESVTTSGFCFYQGNRLQNLFSTAVASALGSAEEGVRRHLSSPWFEGEAWLYSHHLAVAVSVYKPVYEGGTDFTCFLKMLIWGPLLTVGNVSGPLYVAETSVS